MKMSLLLYKLIDYKMKEIEVFAEDNGRLNSKRIRYLPIKEAAF